METLRQTHLSICALAVFANLRKDEVVKRFEKMLMATDTIEQVCAYASFVKALFDHGDNWTEYMLEQILADDNVYVKNRAKGKPVSRNVEDCVREELATLAKIVCIKSADIQPLIDYNGYLPEWRTSDVDLAEVFMGRMNNIRKSGFGIYAKHRMFTAESGNIIPVRIPDPVTIDDLVGYEMQRQMVVDNTRALLDGKPAANALLYGDAGTGKSSTVKAVANAFADGGLRLVEVNKDQLRDIPTIMETLSDNPLKFILLIDDLSFSQENDNYNALKAMLQGSTSAKTQNIVVYATSNRRHLIKETFSERSGDDVHRNETIQELVSLSQRFGLTVGFFRQNKRKYMEIVHALKDEYGIEINDDQLEIEAERFSDIGRTPRAAHYLMENLLRRQQ